MTNKRQTIPMNNFDAWLTKNIHEQDDMILVESEDMMTTPKAWHDTPAPYMVDELSCEDCDTMVGWLTDDNGGLGFRYFYIDDRDIHTKCDRCYREWRESGD